MSDTKQVEAKVLQRVQVHTPNEGPSTVVLEMVTQHCSEYFSLNRAELGKVAELLKTEAEKVPNGSAGGPETA